MHSRLYQKFMVAVFQTRSWQREVAYLKSCIQETQSCLTVAATSWLSTWWFKFNVPPFLGSCQQLEPDEVVRTHHTVTLRIHVERAVERVNKFQITHFFPAMLCPLAGRLIFVCAFRTLFEDPQVLCPPESEWCWSCDGHSFLSVIWHGLELYYWLFLLMLYSCCSCFGQFFSKFFLDVSAMYGHVSASCVAE